ncbi:type VI secretion system Vgr family protein, partial [Pantoea pleuroti]|uniref:type VI secretion system Vgr family protein n=1 Tax=Pantoea pleuroti TaxID=1592631 RepID=UPI001FE70A99
AEHHSVSGSGTATGIAPGFTFAIINAPHFSDNGEYLVTSATYDFAENSYASGDTGDSRHNIHFTVLPSSVTYRTPPETPWPKTHGPQTAKVVGPKGESIWTDRYGRVKVKFHWDRLAKGDDTSSCWVRVSSAWAGQGFGGVQIPRVNDEVVVDFINGDPDRPLIIGRVYNEASMPPWALPAAATQMGFLSRSKDGTADTANALRFEDKSGEEHLWIQAQKNMDTHVKNDASHSVANNHSHYAGGNELYRVETNRVHGVKGGEERLTGKGKLDAVVDTYVVGSGTKLRLECGESAIELNANGQINIVGKGFNIFVQGDGHITTSGGKLNLNTDGAKPGTSAPGSSHKQNISQAVENLFPPKQKGQAAPAAPKAAAAPAKGAAAPLKQTANSDDAKKLDDSVVRSIMKSEGAGGEQGGVPEMYGFRKGFGPAYNDIATARKKYGQGSDEEFEVVSKYMNQTAQKAGALNFSDPGKQAAVMSLAHMRGVGGAQAILNSMSGDDIVKSSQLTEKSIDYVEKMGSSEFQNDLVSARLNYDKAIYGSTTTVKNGVSYNWWDHYSTGLTKRYTNEAAEFLKFSGE